VRTSTRTEVRSEPDLYMSQGCHVNDIDASQGCRSHVTGVQCGWYRVLSGGDSRRRRSGGGIRVRD